MVSSNNSHQGSYHFHIKGEKGIQDVKFQITAHGLESSCTCNTEPEGTLCWHRYYVISGKTKRISDEELSQQYELIKQISQKKEGKDIIKAAKYKFGGKETCRRCNSSKVIDLDETLRGKILKLFLSKKRRYYCKECKWSW